MVKSSGWGPVDVSRLFGWSVHAVSQNMEGMRVMRPIKLFKIRSDLGRPIDTVGPHRLHRWSALAALSERHS